MQRRLFIRQSALGLAALGGTATPLFAAGWKEGSQIPALGQYGLEGSVPSLKGKVVYLDFWASWCGPCKISFPILNQWQATLASKGFTVLAVSVDETAAAMQAFLTKTHVTFPVVRDAAHKLVAAADVTTMPTAFLVDRSGTVRQVHSGFRKQDEAMLAEKINALLGKS
jgi:thiol-disulfide isomerase/thioredoxin